MTSGPFITIKHKQYRALVTGDVTRVNLSRGPAWSYVEAVYDGAAGANHIRSKYADYPEAIEASLCLGNPHLVVIRLQNPEITDSASPRDRFLAAYAYDLAEVQCGA